MGKQGPEENRLWGNTAPPEESKLNRQEEKVNWGCGPYLQTATEFGWIPQQNWG